jgi:hypothetical protein
MGAENKGLGVGMKAAVLVLFIITAVVVVRFTPVKEFLTAAKLGRFLEQAGFLAPLAYMAVYAVGVDCREAEGFPKG